MVPREVKIKALHFARDGALFGIINRNPWFIKYVWHSVKKSSSGVACWFSHLTVWALKACACKDSGVPTKLLSPKKSNIQQTTTTGSSMPETLL